MIRHMSFIITLVFICVFSNQGIETMGPWGWLALCGVLGFLSGRLDSSRRAGR